MRPNPVALLIFSLAAAPVLAQGVAPADRYGASTPRPLPMAVQGPTLTWAGKAPAATVVAAGQIGTPQRIPGGLLAHSSVADAPAVTAPTAPAAPKAPIAAATLAPARAPALAPAGPAPTDLARMAASAPDGLLGVAPPVRGAAAASGAL